MQIKMNEFLFSMILTELEDAVGRENCSIKEIDRVTFKKVNPKTLSNFDYH